MCVCVCLFVYRDIDRNPLECGCMALWLRQWFIDRSLRGPILCMMPFDLQGMDLLELIPDDFCSEY